MHSTIHSRRQEPFVVSVAWPAALRPLSPAGEVFVAVEQTGGSVQRMARIVDSRTLLGRFVGGAEEDPLFGGGHLSAGVWLAAQLQLHRQTVQLHTELSVTHIRHVYNNIQNCL